jgi:hypothetical protein
MVVTKTSRETQKHGQMKHAIIMPAGRGGVVWVALGTGGRWPILAVGAAACLVRVGTPLPVIPVSNSTLPTCNTVDLHLYPMKSKHIAFAHGGARGSPVSATG